MRLNIFPSSAVLALLVATVVGAHATGNSTHADCRCLPGDDCWPSTGSWKSLNNTVDGRLIATVPVGSPCHDPNYDEAACKEIQEQWIETPLHYDSSSSIMAPFFANQSCDPFTARDTPCALGNYVSYSVNVSTPEHVASTLHFARENNVRIVIRNTGHDFYGRSTGAGALSIWTHHLNSTEVIPKFESSFYTGPALKVGAGVGGATAAQAVAPYNLTVVTGECPSVGIAGGYSQGGGHSALSSQFGLAADQVLEWDVVLTDGTITKASPEVNGDLYWAISGGGPGNYAVVTAMTVRAHPVTTVGGGAIQISVGGNVTFERYVKAFEKFHELSVEMADQGLSIVYTVTSEELNLGPLTAYNSTGEHIRDHVAAPFLKYLQQNGVNATTKFTTLPYVDHYNEYLGPLPWGTLNTLSKQFGGRIIPRRTVQRNNKAFTQSIAHFIKDNDTKFLGTVATYVPPHQVSNAVHPAWRDGLMQLTVMTSWSEDPEDWGKMLGMQDKMTDKIMPAIKKVSPDGAGYMNEVDWREPDWKEEFYGPHYETLLTIKRKYDPTSLLYVLKGVGSSSWDVDNTGRMCRGSHKGYR